MVVYIYGSRPLYYRRRNSSNAFWGVQCSADPLYRKFIEMRRKTVTAIQNLCTAFRKSQHLKYIKKLRLCIGPGAMHRRSFST